MSRIRWAISELFLLGVALSPAAGAEALQAAREIGALLRRQHFGRLGERGGDALRGLVGELHHIRPQRLELGAIDHGGSQDLTHLLTQLHTPLAQGPQIVAGALEDGELLFLLAARIDRPAEPRDHALDPSGRQERAAKAAEPVTVAPAARTIVVAITAPTEPAARPIVIAEEAARTIEPFVAPGPLVAAETVVGPAAVVSLRERAGADPDDDSGKNEGAADEKSAPAAALRRPLRWRNWCLGGAHGSAPVADAVDPWAGG